MPVLEVKTTSANSVWKSPDGQREIFELQLEYEGKPVKAKTYSKDISTVGWEGTVETYEKQSRNGMETFVKQPPKENSGYPSSTGSGHSGTQSGGSGYTPRDDSHIKAQWAIGQAVSTLAKDGELDLELTEALAKDLFAMVDRVKSGDAITSPAPEPDTVYDPTEVDMKQLSAVLGDVVPESGEDAPWPPKS